MLILPSRRQFLGGLGGAVALGGATGAYAFGIEPRFRLVVTPYAPVLPNWTPGLNLRVAVLADFHIGEPYMPLDRVAEIVETTNALKPDLVLMLGDYPAGPGVAWRDVPLPEFARVVEGLKAPLGTYSILGNHDWWEDPVAQANRRGPVAARRALEARGIPVLENDAIRLVKDGRPFWVAGLADQQPFHMVHDWRNPSDIPGTLAQVTDAAPILLMIHEPDAFPKVPARVALTMAGHTHGGQIRLFGRSPVIPSRYGQRYGYGHIVEQNRHLVVSGGLGVSRVPVRIGVPPEIVLIDLGAPDRTATRPLPDIPG
ncbi:metallophosphoesterase [Methylobacterium sp. Leaf399]|uniref:metallophosphoesterase n=1 Tax=unclassified Methylobacterium TaxID=2615210 RepID=UPI0006F6D3D8|nr:MULTISPECIES: metallophosphoesterase [unclassified Methylobacterium]KQP61010.1 metallophosphoesterase [Methylobacterium sp. Leaf108]KQT17189.1 metallophosphoesterase [Methylobacterium sp. Leaf399]